MTYNGCASRASHLSRRTPATNRLRIFLAALLALILAPQAWATTYTLLGATYVPAFSTGAYTSATGITGSFTTASPLPANLVNAKIAGGTGGLGLVTSWSFNDGVFTYTDASSAIYLLDGSNFVVSTDAGGTITNFFIILTLPKTGAVVGQSTEFLFLGFDGPGTVSALRSLCLALVTPGGSCEGYNGAPTDQASSGDGATATFTSSGSPPPPPPGPAASIPTLSQYGYLFLALLLAAAAFHALGRKTPQRRHRL